MADDVFELVGTKVAGTFRVENVVAEGGFAVVYRAMHEGFKAQVALKCLKIPQRMSAERKRTFTDQFRAEAELLFKLSARIPNVVRPLHVDAIQAPNGQFMPFLALEWLEGETLDAMAARCHEEGRDMGSLETLVSLLTPVAQALELAHRFDDPEGALSIIHRDIKPENLFVAQIGAQQVVKILDFGIGKAKSAVSQIAGKASTDGSGVQSFTPAFGAPEQWLPKRFGQTGPWTDVFSLALSLVELFVGRPILDGDQAAMMGAALDASRRPTPCNEGRWISPAVESVFEKALAVDPRHRTKSVGEFWRELRSALGMPPGEHALPGSGSISSDSLRRHSHDELDLGQVSENIIQLASLPPHAGLMAEAVSAVEPRRVPQGRPQAATGGRAHVRRAAGAGKALQLPRLSVRPASVTLWRDLLVPGASVLGGLLLAVLGQQYASTSGQVFTVGPVGLGWITTPMLLVGAAAGVARTLSRRDW